MIAAIFIVLPCLNYRSRLIRLVQKRVSSSLDTSAISGIACVKRRPHPLYSRLFGLVRPTSPRPRGGPNCPVVLSNAQSRFQVTPLGPGCPGHPRPHDDCPRHMSGPPACERSGPSRRTPQESPRRGLKKRPLRSHQTLHSGIKTAVNLLKNLFKVPI